MTPKRLQLCSFCVDCPAKAYKPFRGDGPCFECTANVKDGLLPRKSLCECLDGFFRPIISDQNYTTECEGNYHMRK